MPNRHLIIIHTMVSSVYPTHTTATSVHALQVTRNPRQCAKPCAVSGDNILSTANYEGQHTKRNNHRPRFSNTGFKINECGWLKYYFTSTCYLVRNTRYATLPRMSIPEPTDGGVTGVTSPFKYAAFASAVSPNLQVSMSTQDAERGT